MSRIGRTRSDSPVEATAHDQERCFVCRELCGENAYRIHSRDFCNECGCGVKAYEGSLRKKDEQLLEDSLEVLAGNPDAWKQIIYDGWRDKAARKGCQRGYNKKAEGLSPGVYMD